MGWFGSSDSSSSSSGSREGLGLMARADAFQKDVDVMLGDITRMSLPLQSGNEDLDKISNCVKQCQERPERFGNAVQTELNQLQDALLGCQKRCVEQYSSSSSSQADSSSASMERCAVQCYDKNEALLRDISSRLKGLYRNI